MSSLSVRIFYIKPCKKISDQKVYLNIFVGIWRANQILPADGSSRSMDAWKDFVTNFTDVAPLAFGLFGNQCKNPQSMVEKIKEFYHLNDLKLDDPVTDEIAHNVIDVLSDTMFNYAIGKKNIPFKNRTSTRQYRIEY